jgi:predicted nucleic acid-binding protein
VTRVVDASVAVKAALAERWFEVLEDQELAAPTLLWSEAASALRQLVVRGDLRSEEAARALHWLVSARITPHASAGLVVDATELAQQLGWAKTYDAEYLVLARHLDAPLVTSDARLQRGAARLARVAILGPLDV